MSDASHFEDVNAKCQKQWAAPYVESSNRRRRQQKKC